MTIYMENDVANMDILSFKKNFKVLILILVYTFLIRAFTFFISVFDWDESLYMLVANSLFDGYFPYEGVWEQKPPGIFYILYLGRIIFNDTILGGRILSCIFVSLTSFNLYLIAKEITKSNHIITIIPAIVFSTYLHYNDGLAANTEVFFTLISASTNRNPIVNAGIDLYVNLPQDTISVFGSASDPDNDNLTLIWTKLSGPAVTMKGINSPKLQLSGLLVGNYSFELTATDTKGASSSDQMFLQVFEEPAENLPPIADAGEDLILNIPFDTYKHIGSGIDQDGLILYHQWRMIHGPILDNTITYSDTLTLSALGAGEYIYEFMIIDNDSAVATDELTVKVFSGELSDIGAHKVFSPDGNGIDDLWIIDNLDKVAGCPISVFNRFGLKVYESNNYQNDWDGTYNGNPLPDADYYFTVSCENGINAATGGIRIIRDY